MKTVLFACVHNAGRSQMAAALFNALVDPAQATAVSAGTEPAEGVHPVVVAALKEIRIDVSGVKPRQLTPEMASRAHLLVTMGCGEACQAAPGLRREDWPLPDPKGRPMEEVRKIRDQIQGRVFSLIAAEGWDRPA